LQRNGFVTLLAAILTLTTAAAPAGRVPVDGLEALEHVPLPGVRGPLGLRVRAIEALIVLSTRSRSTPALTRAIRKAPRAVCAGLEERPFEIHLRCRSNRIVARLLPRAGGYLLEIGETRGLPWDGEDGPPLSSFSPDTIGLGDPCPGSTPAGKAECLLAQGDRARARRAFESIQDGPDKDFAELRRGDLAHAAGEIHAAIQAWGRVEGQPWQRIAAARLCETSWRCLVGARTVTLYATDGLPGPLARDLLLRRARALAFLGRLMEGVRALLPHSTDELPCAAAPSLCRRLALVALHTPGPDALDGLFLWLETPGRDRGPDAYEAVVAASDTARRQGAPLFAANILAAAAGIVPAAVLVPHLLQTAELYLAGGDRVRAGVVLEFARARAGRRLTGPRWAAVARAASARTAAPPPAPAPVRADDQHAGDAELLAAASRAAEAARAALGGGQP
jgi:hypothetical protein